VSHRGAEEEAEVAVRELVTSTLEEYPMLRSVEERTQMHIRPEAGWNRARMVEWIVSQVVDLVESKLGHGVLPIYLGEDPAFRHVSSMEDKYGVDILITNGPAIDAFYLRSVMQVDELLRWLAEQHAAGVTVRGGRLRSSKLQSQPTHSQSRLASSSISAGSQVSRLSEAGKKRVQISMPIGSATATPSGGVHSPSSPSSGGL
jgi:hypothetical protein